MGYMRKDLSRMLVFLEASIVSYLEQIWDVFKTGSHRIHVNFNSDIRNPEP